MAFPFSRYRDYIADSLPTIKAADLNGLQDYFGHIFGATRSIKKLIVDGTGDAVTTAPGGDTDPTLTQSATIVGTRKLVTYINIGTYKARFYKLDEGFEITVNAVWDSGGATWAYDSGTQASRVYMRRQYFEWTRYGGATGWNDAAWINHMSVAQGLATTFATGVTASTGDVVASAGNVDATTGVTSGRYLKGNGSAPTIAPNANAGTGATASISAGTNSSGRITIVTGTTAAGGVQATVTFAHGGFAAAPNGVILVPADSDSASLADLFYVDKSSVTATVFDISKFTAAADSTTYEFFYSVIA